MAWYSIANTDQKCVWVFPLQFVKVFLFIFALSLIFLVLSVSAHTFGEDDDEDDDGDYDDDDDYHGNDNGVDDSRIEGAGGVVLEPENKLRSVVNDQCFHLGLNQMTLMILTMTMMMTMTMTITMVVMLMMVMIEKISFT